MADVMRTTIGIKLPVSMRVFNGFIGEAMRATGSDMNACVATQPVDGSLWLTVTSDRGLNEHGRPSTSLPVCDDEGGSQDG